ncbi:MAG: ATP-binding cassette domain-containing protein [Desulfobacterales bacterium]|nr:ATP-binding cassette domain-containing protein [Desulfobacterales bacterium]
MGGELVVTSVKVRNIGPCSLRVKGGECLGVQGPSGCGKSTILRAIADMDAHEGEVSLAGVDRLSVGAPAWRRLVGLLPSESAWWEEKVADHFLNPEALDPEILGLSASHFELPVKRLSSGERQRLGLLRLLDRQPEALLLDEPTANLDEEGTRLVEALVLSYAREKSAPVIWVAHNTRQLERVADRLISFNRAGQVCEGRAS